MAPTLLLEIVVRVSVLLAIAAGLTWLLRRQSAAVRHLVWATAIAAALALPVLSLAGLRWQLSVLPAAVVPDSDLQPVVEPVQSAAPTRSAILPATAPAVQSTVTGETAKGEATPGAARTIPPGAVGRSAFRPWQWMLALWAMGFSLVAAHLALGTTRMWWLARHARPASPDTWLRLAQRLAASLGVRSRVVFLEGGPTAMPMTWGLWTARVLLPDSASDWPAARQRVVLLHELAHVRRRDCLTQLLAQVACAVYWFNPLVWMAAKRLRSERERACDDLVLACGTRGSDYADHLLEIARSLRTAAMPTWAAVAMAHPSQLEGRLMAILDPHVPRRSPTRRRSATFAAMAAVFVAPVAVVTPVPRAASAPVEASMQPVLPARAVQAPIPLPSPAPAPAPRPDIDSVEPRPAIAAIAEEAVRDALPDVAADLKAEGWIGESLARVISAAAPAVAQAVGAGVAGGVAGGVSGGISGGIEGGVAESIQAVLAGEARANTPPDPRIVSALVGALKDSDADVRDHALQALARMRAPEALGAIREALTDARPSVREQAAFALGQYRDASSIDPLAGALKDENASVREQAAFALGQIRDPRAVDPLAGALKDENASVREQAVFALGQLRDPRSIGGLTAALKDSQADVREQAAFALGQLRDGAAVDPLIAALGDDSASVREQAAFALGQLRDPRAIDALTAALKDESPEVREQAAFALGRLAR